jgi:serine/threonine-protein kinase
LLAGPFFSPCRRLVNGSSTDLNATGATPVALNNVFSVRPELLGCNNVFSVRPELLGDLQSRYRYNAACSAALAGCHQGEDATKLSESECARLRKQALDWLRADLAAWAKQVEGGKALDRTWMQQVLRHWQKDTDFDGVRDVAALAKLPEAERAEWQKLWADVAALLKKAEAGAKD